MCYGAKPPLRSLFTIAVIAIALSHAGAAFAQSLPQLDPKTYASNSGTYKLLVDPGTEYGQGAAKYRLRRNGVTVWEGVRPFAFWEAAVSDDGVVAGYAYSNGLAGFPTDDKRDATKQSEWNGDFRVVLLGPDGAIRFEKSEQRSFSRVMHSLPVPRAKGVFIDSDNDRFVVRMEDDESVGGVSTWRVYQLADGKRLADMIPRKQLRSAPDFCDDVDARAIPGTKLTLVHWWLWGDKPGAKFALLLPDGRVTWTLDLPGDYSVPDNRPAE